MFHILGFLLFIILVVLVIGLFILSKIVSLVFGFKRRMQGKNSDQRTTYSSHPLSECLLRLTHYSGAH